MLMTEEVIATNSKVRIALSYKLTTQCEKRFHVHQHKDFERDCNRSIRVKQRTSLWFHIHSDSFSDSYWKAFQRLCCEHHWLSLRMWWEPIVAFLPKSTYLFIVQQIFKMFFMGIFIVWQFNKRMFGFTWNIFASAIAIGKLAHVFTALGSGLIRCWLRVKWLGPCRQVTVNVNKLLCMLDDFLRWLQRWTRGTSVNWKVIVNFPRFISYVSFIRRMSSTASSLRNGWLRVDSMLRIASVCISTWLSFGILISFEREKKWLKFHVFTTTSSDD